MKIKHISVTFLLLTFILFFIYYAYLYAQKNQFSINENFSCRASVTIFANYEQDNYVELDINYLFDEREGVIIIRGQHYENSEKPTEINRKILFNINKSVSSFDLVSTETTLLAEEAEYDDKKLIPFLDPFYLSKGMRYVLKIAPHTKNDLIFSTNSVPFLVCQVYIQKNYLSML